jgi:hypothetical protein
VRHAIAEDRTGHGEKDQFAELRGVTKEGRAR